MPVYSEANREKRKSKVRLQPVRDLSSAHKRREGMGVVSGSPWPNLLTRTLMDIVAR